MAVSQRIDQTSSRHPRITFASGFATGAAVVVGLVIAAAAVTGVGERAEPSTSVFDASNATLTDAQLFSVEQDFRSANGIGSDEARAASMTDEQLFNAEQDYRSENGVGLDETRSGSMTDEQLYNAEQEFRSTNRIGSGQARTAPMTDVQLFNAEQDYRSANGIAP